MSRQADGSRLAQVARGSSDQSPAQQEIRRPQNPESLTRRDGLQAPAVARCRIRRRVYHIPAAERSFLATSFLILLRGIFCCTTLSTTARRRVEEWQCHLLSHSKSIKKYLLVRFHKVMWLTRTTRRHSPNVASTTVLGRRNTVSVPGRRNPQATATFVAELESTAIGWSKPVRCRVSCTQ
jgi:hypothetical protein